MKGSAETRRRPFFKLRHLKYAAQVLPGSHANSDKSHSCRIEETQIAVAEPQGELSRNIAGFVLDILSAA